MQQILRNHALFNPENRVLARWSLRLQPLGMPQTPYLSSPHLPSAVFPTPSPPQNLTLPMSNPPSVPTPPNPCRRSQQMAETGGDELEAVKKYFNTAGFERWQKIYGETDEVNKV